MIIQKPVFMKKYTPKYGMPFLIWKFKKNLSLYCFFFSIFCSFIIFFMYIQFTWNIGCSNKVHEVQATTPPPPPNSNYTFTIANLGENITVMLKRFCVESKLVFNTSNYIIFTFSPSCSVNSVGSTVLKIGIFANDS